MSPGVSHTLPPRGGTRNAKFKTGAFPYIPHSMFEDWAYLELQSADIVVLSRNHDITKSMDTGRPNSGGYAHLSDGTNTNTNGFVTTEGRNNTNSYEGDVSPTAPYVQQGHEVWLGWEDWGSAIWGFVELCVGRFVFIYRTVWVSASLSVCVSCRKNSCGEWSIHTLQLRSVMIRREGDWSPYSCRNKK